MGAEQQQTIQLKTNKLLIQKPQSKGMLTLLLFPSLILLFGL
jgi:hypothetical protein